MYRDIKNVVVRGEASLKVGLKVSMKIEWQKKL